jgi:hypothetical protein
MIVARGFEDRADELLVFGTAERPALPDGAARPFQLGVEVPAEQLAFELGGRVSGAQDQLD